MGPWAFYINLSDDLLDNSFDTTELRSQRTAFPDLITAAAPVAGTGIHLVATSRKRKRRDGTPTNHIYQGKCMVCRAKSKRFFPNTGRQAERSYSFLAWRRVETFFERHVSGQHGR